MWYIILYLLLVVINYYSIRAFDKYIETKIKKRNWPWGWSNILLIALLSLLPIFSFLIVFTSELHNLIKLPKNPPRWL